MINRTAQSEIDSYLFKGKAILVFGARQVGKTSLIKNTIKDQSYLWLNGDEPDTQLLLENITTDRLKALIGDNKILVIDEAQMIHNIGLLIKRMVDNYPEIQVIASGSSAFELADKTKESMVGRKQELQLFPLSYSEMVKHSNFIEETRLVPHRLVFGYYPEVVTNTGKEEKILNDLVEGFLYKDILNLEGVKKSATLQRLVQMLAYRIGSEISYNSLANDLGINRLTVEKYIDILEKNFIVFSLNAFSRNQDNELKKGRKVYFWDNGLRNRIIKNFNPIELRDDIGALWENFIVSERKKKLSYENQFKDTYFWRNTQQAEIDYLEVKNTEIEAFEIKYNPNQKVLFTKSFTEKYHPKTTQVIHKENFWDYLI
ncbi:ATP-binding protein [Flavobacterium alvei]|uniref:ATP-binding protein n=1 Tax=Flavobacterium alvei TaxID=2080416 RepID=UPI0026F27E55|nr:ATP-binding protein [Flavobacterium alvei]